MAQHDPRMNWAQAGTSEKQVQKFGPSKISQRQAINLKT
jgi:hypothetical protein